MSWCGGPIRGGTQWEVFWSLGTCLHEDTGIAGHGGSQEARQADGCEFEASVVYRVGSRLAEVVRAP